MRFVGLKQLHQLLIVILIFLNRQIFVLMHAFDISHHVVYVLVARFNTKLFVDDCVHLSHREAAL